MALLHLGVGVVLLGLVVRCRVVQASLDHTLMLRRPFLNANLLYSHHRPLIRPWYLDLLIFFTLVHNCLRDMIVCPSSIISTGALQAVPQLGSMDGGRAVRRN